MAREVSRNTLGLHFTTVRRLQADMAAFLEGTSLNPDALPEWVDWADFVLLTRRLTALCGGLDELARLGEQLIDVESLRHPVNVLRLGITPRLLYWANVKWGGPGLFRNLQDTEFEALPDGRFRITLHIPDRDEDCPEFFFLNQGLFRMAPRLIGLQPAIVDVEVSAHTGVFNIFPPPSMDLWSRMSRMASLLVATWRGVESPTLTTFNFLVEQQDHLRATNRELQDARSLAEAQRRIAEEALEVKSQFLATMSHELRTPLNGIMGVAELLAMTSLDREQREYAETVRTSGETLLAIINDILDFSKHEAGHLEVDSVEFSLRDVVYEVAELFAGRAHARDLELITLIDPELPDLMRGSQRAVQQILTNLVSNAVKFTDEGEVEIRVKWYANPRDGRPTACLHVRDTGLGIAAADFDRLFVPFTQLDATETRRHGGTGLGLAICKQLAAAVGGTITVESHSAGSHSVDHGSVFHVSLPLVPLVEPARRAPASLARALLVDDNAAQRTALGEELAQAGVSSATASSADEGMRRLIEALDAHKPFEAVFVDDALVDNAGRSLVRAIRAHPALASLPVVLLTRSVSGSPDEAALRMGDVRTLHKPIRSDRLGRLLDRWTEVRPEATAPPPNTSAWRAPRHPDGTRRRVLVAEDHELNQRVARGMLEALDLDTTLVSDGAQALAELSRGRPDLVLMDCQMPLVDGMDATRQWRGREGRGARLPIIAMTAYASEGDRERCLAAGMDDVVTKPVRMERLADALQRWLLPHATTPVPAANGADERRQEERSIQHRLAEFQQWMDTREIDQMVEAFTRETSVDLANLEHATAMHDLDAVVRTAHRLKGACRNLGAELAADACNDLSARARTRAVSEVQQTLPLVRRRMASVLEILAAPMSLARA